MRRSRKSFKLGRTSSRGTFTRPRTWEESGASSARPSAIREGGAALARQLAVVDEAFDARRAPGRGAHTASARPVSDFG